MEGLKFYMPVNSYLKDGTQIDTLHTYTLTVPTKTQDMFYFSGTVLCFCSLYPLQKKPQSMCALGHMMVFTCEQVKFPFKKKG